MKNHDTKLHVQGMSQFTDDITLPGDLLYATVFTAPSSHGIIKRLDLSLAKKTDGIVDILSSEDIPGTNQIGHIIHDEPLLAEKVFEYAGQPIALVVGKTQRVTQRAAKLIGLEYENFPAIYDARVAYENGKIIGNERIFEFGNTATVWKKCKYVYSNKVESGAQEHLYLETHGAVAIPLESGRMKIISSTQSPSGVQKTVADVLGVPLNQVEVDVIRLGGGFGGKEDQANVWAALAAMASSRLKKPVKLILPRHLDITITGKRHPYSSDFTIGLSEDLKILAYEVTYFQNAGAYADLSPAILERTMFHCTNSYFIPNVKAKGISCKTNLPPNTAFRGFGGPQAMFVIECAIEEAASKLQLDANDIRRKNFISKGEAFPYGMQAQTNNAKICTDIAFKEYNVKQRIQQIHKYNDRHTDHKKGLAVMPVCFGISFTNTFLNQAGALVHIYTDGSISISTGAIEMGQGVNEKIRKVAATIFSVADERIMVESTNTTRIANMSPTAASTGADMNGNATRIACEEIRKRILSSIPGLFNAGAEDRFDIINEFVYHNRKKTTMGWEELIGKIYRERISLSSHAFYATPEIFFDRTKEKGCPFSYHVQGTAIVEVTLDCLLGNYTIDAVDVIHDTGSSFAPLIDMGQMEGGIVQGLGWMTMEEVVHSGEGKLLSNTLSTYKVPDIFSVPQRIQVKFLDKTQKDKGIFGSKAIGEPPFMYGIGVFFALMNAIKSFRPDLEIIYSAPLTNEKILFLLNNENLNT
jgi:xanthine dehydrogenase large subunit